MLTFRQYVENRDGNELQEGWKDWAKTAAMGSAVAGGLGTMAYQGVKNVNAINQQAMSLNPQHKVEKTGDGFVYTIDDHEHYDKRQLQIWIKHNLLEKYKGRVRGDVIVREVEPGVYHVRLGMDPATLMPPKMPND